MLASEIPTWFVRVFAFAFGAIWGSFANVVIYRWPRELSVVKPASHCFACKKPIAPYDNVPIFAYLWLRGRCRHCGAKFSPRYAIVELIFAIVSTAIAERVFFHAAPLEPQIALVHYVVRFAVAFILLTTTFIDLDEMIVPWFVKWFAAIPLAAAFLLPRIEPGVDVVHALAGAAMGYLGLRVLFIDGYRVLTGRRGMGLGDAEVLLVVGALLGPAGVLFTLGAGAVQGVIATVIVRLAGGRIGPEYADEVGDEEEESERETVGDNEIETGDRVEGPTSQQSDTNRVGAGGAGLAPGRVSTESVPAENASRVSTAPTTAESVPAENASADDAADPGGDADDDGTDEGAPITGRSKVPFVPFLALAALEYLLGADHFVDAYLRLVRGD